MGKKKSVAKGLFPDFGNAYGSGLSSPQVKYKEGDTIVERAKVLFAEIESQDVATKIETINRLRLMLHEVSPFRSEPVDCIQWVKSDLVYANEYNPNAVAPPEMKLLEVSIHEDGYTQPIVTFATEHGREVVDGFHRNRVGKECQAIRDRVLGYLPVVSINQCREDKGDRIASTIRHNRARGKHQVTAMSDIVVELKRRNWSDERISKNLGMDQDEILRLCQITGLSELFSDQQFSKSWDVEGDITESDFVELTDDTKGYGDDLTLFRTVNTSDPNRVFHTFDKWECHKAGFYNGFKEGMTKEQCEQAYCEFLSDIPRFSEALKKVISEWKNSCEHYLTNAAMNRIAWLGQASMCYATGVPSAFRSGYFLLTNQQKKDANQIAFEFLNEWLVSTGRKQVTMEEACPDRQSEIY